MHTVEIVVAGFPEEKSDGAIRIRRLRRKLVKERNETGVEGVWLFNKRKDMTRKQRYKYLSHRLSLFRTLKTS